MEELLMYIELIEDKRQQTKVKHKLLDIVVIVLFAKLSNADDWEEIEDFAVYNENYLKKYIELKNGIPSHDTIQRVMSNIDPRHIQKLYDKWNELLSKDEGEKLKKIICIDGKTIRGSKSKNHKAQHIVSAWCDNDGFCLWQKSVEEKTNEITAIPRLINTIMIKGAVITIDAIGTQIAIAEKIKEKRADYVLAVKENQSNLYNNIIELFSKAVRQHWSVEIMHWHLDVTFKEDANKTQDKTAVQNLNIINKWCLSILKIFQIGNKKRSMKKKRFCISMNTEKFLEQIINL